jgi:beta-lactam-binding protein with PASTA domain
LPEGAARADLERHGFRVTAQLVITRQSRRRGPSVGTVVASLPAPGTRRRVGDRIRIDVEEASVEVPGVMGQPFAVAVRLLATAELQVGDTTGVVSNDAEAGTVTGMAPSPGAFVRPGTAISLVIAHRRVVDLRPLDVRVRPQLCTVPSLLRLTEQQARKVLQDGSWPVGQVSHGAGTTVTDQNPKANTTVRCGTLVGFTVGSVIRE